MQISKLSLKRKMPIKMKILRTQIHREPGEFNNRIQMGHQMKMRNWTMMMRTRKERMKITMRMPISITQEGGGNL
jgi:hypothetical protein